ncbi:MAG TPA: copper oxidase [Thermomicrobiales bacterium]|nr:copper oxidase [Thermomicrobiales bacterium]
MGLISRKIDRRRLASLLGLAGAGAAAAAVAPAGFGVAYSDAVNAATASGEHAAMAAQTDDQSMTVAEMDQMHEAGVRAFPAQTEGLGGQPLSFKLDGAVKVFELSCGVVQWEYALGKRVEAFAYNGVVPGPEIRVAEGDTVRVVVENIDLPQSTSVHFHGLVLPNAMDGVPFMTQKPIEPGKTFTYEFPIREGNAGSHMYHSHHNSAEQVSKGMLGPFIVEPKDPASWPSFDKEYTLILNDGPIGGFTINGKGFPATSPLTAKKGERILVRYMNEGQMIHPMHLHGLPQTVIAQDGYLLPQPYRADTVAVDPGQRIDVLVDATEPGIWAYHCHILSHAESQHGMFGMVTALIVEE